jgi:hypothetical protein
MYIKRNKKNILDLPTIFYVQHVMGTKVYLFLALFIHTLSPSVLVMYSNVSVHHNHFKFIFQLWLSYCLKYTNYYKFLLISAVYLLICLRKYFVESFLHSKWLLILSISFVQMFIKVWDKVLSSKFIQKNHFHMIQNKSDSLIIGAMVVVIVW